MYEEQRLMAAGMPFSEAVLMCRDVYKEQTMGRFEMVDPTEEEHHTCKCGGVGNCLDCPNRNK